MKKIIYSILTLSLFFTLSSNAQVLLDVETGLVSTGYNDVRSPGNIGTFFSLKEDLQSKTSPFLRLRAGYIINSRHSISLLYAPLKTISEGSTNKPILFENVLFPANTALKGTYIFNSYRLTYRYDFVYKPKFIFGLGFTAKIRDASIQLSSAGITAEKTNTGFVPIINFKLWWQMNEKIGLLINGDALAAPQGRAEDVLIAASYKLSDNIDIRGGYRILEGGADNDEVYSFALFHYFSVGITYTFKNKNNYDE